MRLSRLFLIVMFCVLSRSSVAQLTPGFDKAEYIDLIHISAHTTIDSGYYKSFEKPKRFTKIYESAPVALDNLWDLWISTDRNVAVISIRGTTKNQLSWLENFYAAMVPASGTLQLEEGKDFIYKLAENPKAAIHVGWLVGMAFLATDIKPKMDSLYDAGVNNFLIVGHSQGGAIAYLLTAHLNYLKKNGNLPPDLRIKTYCSAAPKPGNLYFAYNYEQLTQNGWAYNVVNAADWVPETPISIQTLNDFNETNPFGNAKGAIRKQKFPTRIALSHAYKKLTKPTLKALRNYQKYLGDFTSKQVRKEIKNLKTPGFYKSNYYVRAGNTITLSPDEDYYKLFPDDPEHIFQHHLHKPYLYLANKLNEPFYSPLVKSFEGKWELAYLSGTRIAFEGLYPGKKPFVMFDMEKQYLYGNSSCNSFSSSIKISTDSFKIVTPFVSTKMFCDGEGEKRFYDMLEKADRSWFEENYNTLVLGMNQVPIMRFKKVAVVKRKEESKDHQQIYFKAHGNEPFWNLEVKEETIQFKSLVEGFEMLSTPHTEPIIAADADVKRYNVSVESGIIQFQISKRECSDGMSDEIFSYHVIVDIKKGIDSVFTTFSGCGQYLMDYRLHDIWVLRTVNGKAIEPTTYGKEFPRIEINNDDKKFFGFDGTKEISGSLFSERNLLRFQVEDGREEKVEFVKLLTSGTTYRLDFGKLVLENPSGLKLEFIKVD